MKRNLNSNFILGTPLTPLHQPEEDQLILPNALQQQQQQPISQVPPLAPMGGLTPTLGLGMGMSMSSTKYVPGYAAMNSLSSQTPVSTKLLVISKFYAC